MEVSLRLCNTDQNYEDTLYQYISWSLSMNTYVLFFQERRRGQRVRQVPRPRGHRLPLGGRPHPGRRPARPRQRAGGRREQLHGRDRAQVQVHRATAGGGGGEGAMLI